MVVTEIFRSIQGESSHAGRPCVFVRLTGCNLRCRWCDTAYAFHGGRRMTIDEVLDQVHRLSGGSGSPTGLVELTGGEPLLQPDAPRLAERLVEDGYQVLIETSGERFVGSLPRAVVKIVDVKCPDSGEGDSFHMANLDVLDAKDEVKFVIASRRDYEFACRFISEHRLAERAGHVIFSPVVADPLATWDGLDPRSLAEWILADRLPVRLGLQIHKQIWDPAAHGV
jgi:7-carboxy-7-deazaguanine synthase